MELEPVPEFKRLRPFSIGHTEVADEACDDVLEPGLRQCGQERPGIALAEEAAGVGDPETITATVLQPGEVIEVGAVQDRRDNSRWLECACLLRNRLRRGDDDIGLACNQTRDRLADLLLGADRSPLDAPVRMSADGVTQVCDPTRSGDPLHRGADEMHRVRRRGRDDHVDPLCARDANRRRDRRQVPAHVLVRHEHAT